MLGLISSTSQGAEILDDYRWEATLSPLGLPTGLCIPMDVEKFVSVSRQLRRRFNVDHVNQIPPWEPPPDRGDSDSLLLPPTTPAELEVVTAIQNLANTVIANAASRSLAK